MTNQTEIEVTPGMLDAGIKELLAFPILEADEEMLKLALANAFRSMMRLRPLSHHATH
jgi:hypothetical protein